MTFSLWSSLDERGGILRGKTERHGGSGWGEERGGGDRGQEKMPVNQCGFEGLLLLGCSA